MIRIISVTISRSSNKNVFCHVFIYLRDLPVNSICLSLIKCRYSMLRDITAMDLDYLWIILGTGDNDKNSFIVILFVFVY